MNTTPEAPGAGPEQSHQHPTPPPGPDSGPRATREEVRDLGRLRRSRADRKVAGVAGGLGRHLDIDPVVVRVALVVLTFFGGAGLIIYGACWLLVPEEGAERAPLGLDERNRTIALAVIGGIAVLALLGDSVGQFDFPWPLAVIGVVALVVLTQLDRRSESWGFAPADPTAPPAPPATAGSGGTTTAPPTAPMAPAPPAAWGRPPAPPREPRNPRKRGPVLFWFTLALSAVAVGLLATLDLAGVDVADSAYPALVLGVVGLMLLVGSVWGRPGGLIFVGLVAALATAATTAAGEWDGTTMHLRPATAADVRSSYDIGGGEIRLDLGDVADLEALDGRLIRLRADVGHVEVIVPEALSVVVRSRVDAIGGSLIFDEEHGGFDIREEGRHDGGPGAPELTIEARVGVGEVEVHTVSSLDDEDRPTPDRAPPAPVAPPAARSVATEEVTR
ncbi:PspC domain-containing protein [Nocardioides sp. SYSU D00038]|uniref:PspC domain-containing protein n=1 Tax=Nocardioides sp. SYSU D00038 TaxID=2812554 RepID=UPI001967C32A|nr:PspC domain-containing protein [Nocardioides sp. SYSU D00038]